MGADIDVVTATARELKHLLAEGKTTSRDLNVAPRQALYDLADALDKERSEGRICGDLHGIPIVLKDCIATATHRQMPTTLGSHAFETAYADQDAAVVDLFTRNGAIVFAKAAMTELCGTKGSNLTTGWSALNGQVQSAYVSGGVRNDNLIFGHSTPGGPSSGSAVAVSAGFGPLAIGTETDGSVLGPARRAGLYGFKTATGTIPMEGVFKLTGYDSIGVMAKSSADVVMMLNALMRPAPDFNIDSLQKTEFKDLAVGFVDPKLWRLPESICAPDERILEEMDTAFNIAKAAIQKTGAKVAFVTLPPADSLTYEGTSAISSTMCHELKIHFKNFTSLLPNPQVHTLADLIQFNEDHASQEFTPDHSDQSALIQAQQDSSSAEFIKAAQNHCKKLAGEDGIDKVLTEHNVDVIVVPGDSAITALATCAGYAIAAVPNGILSIHGRPHGLSIVTKKGKEVELLRSMFAFEKTFPGRPVPPRLARPGASS